ncbi:hypothetical protein Tco_0052476 [Tanacetum coccineum]
MHIPAWMITDEMKQTEHYRMYAKVFGIDVPLTQSQPTESTQGTHRTPSAPRSPNPDKEVAESSAPRRSTVIRLCILDRRSTHLTPPAPMPTFDKADEMILQDTLQVSLAEHKSHEEQEARENVALVDEHLASEEIEKMVDGQENIVDDSSIPRNDEPSIPDTRIEPRSDKESPEVEIAKEKEQEISKENERREKGKIVEETRNSPILTPIRSPRIHTNLISSDTEKLQELTDTPHTTSSSSSPHKKLAKTNRLLSPFKTKPTRFTRTRALSLFTRTYANYLLIVINDIKEQVVKQVPKQVRNQVPVYVAEGLILERQKVKEETERLIAKAILQERGNIQAQIENAIANVIPSQVDASIRSYMSGHILYVHLAQSQTSTMKFKRNTVLQTACRTSAVHPRDHDILMRSHKPRGRKVQSGKKTSEYRSLFFWRVHHLDKYPQRNKLYQLQEINSKMMILIWTDSYASDEDEIPIEASITRNYEDVIADY